MNRCIFCDEFADPSSARSFLGATWPFSDRILSRTPNFIAVPGYGPQIFPYILLISRRHVLSLAELRGRERVELLHLLSVVCNRLALARVTVFEHSGCRGFHSCIEHFHLHVIPGVFDLRRSLDSLDYTDLVIDARDALEIPGAYLFAGVWEDSKAEIQGRVAPVSQKRDQFFRGELANLLEQEEWDWRIGMNEEWMRMLAMIFKQPAQTSRS